MVLYFRRLPIGRYRYQPAIALPPSFFASLSFGSLRCQSSTTTKAPIKDEMTKETKALADALLGVSSAAASTSPSPSNHKRQTLQRRMALAKAITLIESKTIHQMRQADLLMNYLARIQSNESGACDDAQGSSFRIGISGPPGAGRYDSVNV